MVAMGHGDVMISRHKGPKDPKPVHSKPVASQATLALCGTQNSGAVSSPDPRLANDPWSAFKPSSPYVADASQKE